MSMSVPLQFQEWLQQLYRLAPLAPVDAFLIEGAAVNGPTETLLLREQADALELGLYLDPRAIARVEARGGLAGFAEQPLEDFWTVLEGVSHFVCLGWHAGQERAISALDLELQAEIDKFVTAWQLGVECGLGDLAEPLHEQLFQAWRLPSTMSAANRARYREASHLAARYCMHLRQRHGQDLLAVREELRHFFRLPPRRRRDFIQSLACSASLPD